MTIENQIYNCGLIQISIFTCKRLFEVYFRFGMVENGFGVAGNMVDCDGSISSEGDDDVSHLDIRKLNSKSSDWLWLVLNDRDLANELLKYWHDAGVLIGDTLILLFGENSKLSFLGNLTSVFSIFFAVPNCLQKKTVQTPHKLDVIVVNSNRYFYIQ